MSERPMAFDWSDDVELLEQIVNPCVYFTGIRAAAVDGVADLMFYVEQPSTYGGGTECAVIARLMTPLARAKAVLDSAICRLSSVAAVRATAPEELRH
jgi:hypothetical protein